VKALASDDEPWIFTISTSDPFMTVQIHAVNRPDIAPFPMPERFVHEITFFMAMPGEAGVPKLPAREYWVRLTDAQGFLEEGVVRIVSPLDSDTKAEIELSEEQETWLEWMIKFEIEHIRIT
jgi:hypothetical protein